MIKTAFGLPVMSRTWAKAWEGLSASQPVLYICLVLVAALLGYAYELRTRGIFACRADGYTADRYLAYCNGVNYADYEHGAFYFGLEPSVQHFVREADVLFLGNSRLQLALSTAATDDWFAAASAHYYLMGFLYFENELFSEKILQLVSPKAEVYVINMDNFFDRSESPPVKTILHDATARYRYQVKGLWQRVHKSICQAVPRLCGDQYVIFRSRATGAYYREGILPQQRITPVSYDWSIDQDLVMDKSANAMGFLSHFAQGKCVILTMVPFVGAKIGDAKAIAARLGMKLVTPGILDGLQTFDGYHLDHESAQRWSQAFFQAAGPTIRSCLEERGVPHPVGSSLSATPR